ncbi:hypothetical protein [Kitasatospora cinereorecta]|uniref:Uncharacterized protein n=1 Tax=Kitasatospora cinereorecta TaxID=285560 RepID=A0ABW0V6Y2_9ACTN
MTTNVKPNQQLLDDLASLSTPDHFGKSLLRSLLKKASTHDDPTKPIDITVTFRVHPVTAHAVVDHGTQVCDEYILPSGTIVSRNCSPHELPM